MKEQERAQLEAAVDRELKALPNLRAPQQLVQRIMAVIEQRAVLPWYRRPWPTWPLPLQIMALCALLAAFAGLCLGGWLLIHVPAVASATSEASGCFRMVGRTLETLGSVVNALALAVMSIGGRAVIGIVAALLFGCAVCIGFGTWFVRLAYARR